MENLNNRHDPIQTLRNIRTELKGSHDRYHYQVASVYYQAQQIAGNSIYLERFRTDSCWHDIAVPTCVLRAAMRFAWDAAQTNTGDYKAAVFASSALKYYFDDNVPAQEVYELIKMSGGIDPLDRDQPPHSQATRGKGQDLQASYEYPVDGSEAANSGVQNESKTPRPKSSVHGQVRRSSPLKGSGSNGPKKFSRAWCEDRLCIDIDFKSLSRVLKLTKRAKGTIDFVAEGPDESGFLVFRAVKVTFS